MGDWNAKSIDSCLDWIIIPVLNSSLDEIAAANKAYQDNSQPKIFLRSLRGADQIRKPMWGADLTILPNGRCEGPCHIVFLSLFSSTHGPDSITMFTLKSTVENMH